MILILIMSFRQHPLFQLSLNASPHLQDTYPKHPSFENLVPSAADLKAKVPSFCVSQMPSIQEPELEIITFLK